MSYLSIRDLDLQGKRVFIRVDFNVPLAKNEQGEMEITSDKRIKASLPTIQYALEQGAALILASHLGRPKGKPNPEMSLKPVAARLAAAAEVAGRRWRRIASDRKSRRCCPRRARCCCSKICAFTPRKRRTIPAFSKQLAALCDVYVNDAFGSRAPRARLHRRHDHITCAEGAAGLLMEKELKYLGMVTTNPPRPCVAILGGAKVSDKIEVIENLSKSSIAC